MVVDGPNGDSGGIVTVLCRKQERKYDHSRHNLQYIGEANWNGANWNNDDSEVETWHFATERADGTACWLHPDSKGTDCRYGEINHSDRVEVRALPVRGCYGDKFPKWYTFASVDKTLKFDRTKNIIKT